MQSAVVAMSLPAICLCVGINSMMEKGEMNACFFASICSFFSLNNLIFLNTPFVPKHGQDECKDTSIITGQILV